MRVPLLLLLLCSSFSAAYAALDFDTQQIQDRIKPVGSVRVQSSQPAVNPEPKAAEPVVAKAPGQEIYEQYCTTCHQNGLAGAPIAHDANAWKPRLAAKNLDQLTASAIKGLNAMPPKGTCGDCTDAQIKEAVQFMLPK